MRCHSLCLSYFLHTPHSCTSLTKMFLILCMLWNVMKWTKCTLFNSSFVVCNRHCKALSAVCWTYKNDTCYGYYYYQILPFLQLLNHKQCKLIIVRLEQKTWPYYWNPQSGNAAKYLKQNEAQSSRAEPTYKGVNQHLRRQRTESPMVTLTWHAGKYKVHKLH